MEIGEIGVTLKARIYPDGEQAKALDELTKIFANACEWVSSYAFYSNVTTTKLMTSKYALHSDVYYLIRGKFNMKSQLAESVVLAVTSRYKSVRTQLRETPYIFFNPFTGEYEKEYRNTLNWLKEPIHFKRPQADLVRDRDWSLVVDKKTGETLLSIATMTGRVRVRFRCEGFDKYLDGTWKFGTAKLVRSGGKWYFHISATRTFQDLNPEQVEHCVGIDRGLKAIVAFADDGGNTGKIEGAEILKTRDKYDRTRASLQSKGTKGAKRVLKRISGRENRYMADVNHQISKALCEAYPENTLFVLEDLTGISFDKRNLHGGKQSHNLRSWSFYDLEKKLKYKAAMGGSVVIKVDPAFTSQRCPCCGNIDKNARDKDKRLYTCPKCGYEENDDITAGYNLVDLGFMYLGGAENPTFREPKNEQNQTSNPSGNNQASNTTGSNSQASKPSGKSSASAKKASKAVKAVK